MWCNTDDYDGLSAGSTDISVDGQFLDPANEDYHLTVDSPVIDAGTTLDWLHVDYDGDRCPRPSFDIAADEYATAQFFFVPLVLKSYSA